MNKHQFHVTRDLPGFGFQVQHVKVDPRGTVAIAQPVQYLITKPDGEHLPVAPMLLVDEAGAQELLDELWNAGLRPSDLNRQPATANAWLQEQLAKFISHATRSTL